MYEDDYYNPTDPNDFDDDHMEKMFEKSKRMDRGYNAIYRKALRKDGKMYNKKIEIYTSGGTGTRIRDAETGEYYSNIVGSKDEDLFFKVTLATGECTSANGSTNLFYNSPQHYASHLLCDVDPKMVLAWEEKRDARLLEIKYAKKLNSKSSSVEVR